MPFNKTLEHSAHMEDIEAIREDFKPLSAQMIELSKTFDPMEETIYEDSYLSGRWPLRGELVE
ncbi:MAG: DUF3347 domain-containing protein [Bacteroidetes bacterium]|nr:DUF3347 domain-containing protein [Bacteroidota bacterium]